MRASGLDSVGVLFSMDEVHDCTVSFRNFMFVFAA